MPGVRDRQRERKTTRNELRGGQKQKEIVQDRLRWIGGELNGKQNRRQRKGCEMWSFLRSVYRSVDKGRLS